MTILIMILVLVLVVLKPAKDSNWIGAGPILTAIADGASEDEIKKLVVQEGLVANAANSRAVILKSRAQRGIVALVTVSALLLLLGAASQ